MTALTLEFKILLSDTAARLGIQIDGNMDEVRLYAAERMEHLSTIVDQRGFHEALVAEAANVTMKAAGRAVDMGDAADAELFGVIAGALGIAARAIAGGVA